MLRKVGVGYCGTGTTAELSKVLKEAKVPLAVVLAIVATGPGGHCNKAYSGRG